MNWIKIFRIDGLKVFIIVIFLLYPYVSYYGSITNVEGDHNHVQQTLLGLPLNYINFDYSYDNLSNEYTPKISSIPLNFLFDIIIAYLVGVLIYIFYYKFKKEK